MIQLAKAMGMHVTGVCSARNAQLASSLGADVVIDYALRDFCAGRDRYDMVVELVGNRSLRDQRGLVRPSVTLVLSGGGTSGDGRFLGPLSLLMRAQLMARLPGPRIVTPQAKPSKQSLEELATFVSSGALTPVIDRTFPFDDAAEAIRYLEVEHARAKVVISIG